MLIFPKKITKDESVIIHVRIKNYDDIVKYLQLRTYIEDPNGKIVKKFNKDFILNINSSNQEYKDFYFEFKPNKKSNLGKYTAKTNLYYKGEVLHSLTLENDYFYIEEINANMVVGDKKKIVYIKNLSCEETLCNLILIKDNYKKIKTCKLLGNHEQKLEFYSNQFDDIYIKYGNNFCEKICKKNDAFYIRNNLYKWERIDDRLLLFNEKKRIILNNISSYIWLCCDGLTSIIEIANYCEMNVKQMKKILKKLERKKLISLIRY